MNNIHVVAISGSLRKKSQNTALAHQLHEYLPEGVTIEVADISDIPFYNADLDLPLAETRPASVTKFRETLTKADAIIFVSPEYNYSIPGVLKNAIDWASRGTDSPLLKKAVALMGATPGQWGTIRMQLAFHPIFQFLDMKPVQKPEVLIQLSTKKFDEEGRLTDEVTKDLIRKKLQALKTLVLELRLGNN